MRKWTDGQDRKGDWGREMSDNYGSFVLICWWQPPSCLQALKINGRDLTLILTNFRSLNIRPASAEINYSIYGFNLSHRGDVSDPSSSGCLGGGHPIWDRNRIKFSTHYKTSEWQSVSADSVVFWTLMSDAISHIIHKMLPHFEHWLAYKRCKLMLQRSRWIQSDLWQSETIFSTFYTVPIA